MAKSIKKKEKSSLPPQSSIFGELDRIIDNFKRDFERSFMRFPEISFPSFPKVSETRCDIIDEGEQLRVKMDMPGINKNEINLNVSDNSIEVTGEHKEEEKKKNYLRKERRQVSYYQTIPLSEKIIPEQVKAKLSDGVLDVVLPKSRSTSAQKKTSINVQ